VGSGRVGVQGGAMRGDLAEKAQGIRLMPAFLVLADMRQGLLGEGLRLLQTASQQLRLTQGETTERLMGYQFHGNALFHRLREQRHSVSDATAQGVRRAQGCSYRGEIGWKSYFVTDAHSPFEQGKCSGQVALAQGQHTDPP